MDASTARIADLLDHTPTPANPTPGPLPPEPPAEAPAAAGRTLTVTVVWGDLARVEADVHVTGHYQDVAPAAAELALDRAISAGPHRLITEHTRHGWIDARLGEVTYFPARGGPVRSAAVVGMGRMGTFTERRSAQLYESLLTELMALGHVRRAATVLIGSGAGNLPVPQAARALVGGFAAALGSQPGPPEATPELSEVYVVELDRLRAAQLIRALADEARDLPAVHVTSELQVHPGGRLSRSSAAVYAVTGLTRLARAATAPGADDSALQAVLDALDDEVRPGVRHQLLNLGELDVTDMALSVRPSLDLYGEPVPVRISVIGGDDGLRWAALTERATVPERQVPVDADLLHQLVTRLTGPSVADARSLPDLLSRLVVPPEFQQLISADSSLELELDRETAAMPWEFLTDLQDTGGALGTPLAVRTPIARRLRTTYSRVLAETNSAEPTRVLVIGDPGDPEKGMGLPGARTEAKAVAAELERLGVPHTVFIGADAAGGEPGYDPATRLDVLRTLLRGEYQIVHYCGHGTFDDSGPVRRSGWVFADGLLSAQELAHLDRPPRMVVANACWSARLAVEEPANARTALIPSLADEFLRAGVAHYVGAGWQVPDRQGVGFARSFYPALLGDRDGSPRAAVGEAVKRARAWMYQNRDGRLPGAGGAEPEPNGWSAWAAYQHYGDPADVFSTAETPRESPR